MRPTSPVSLNLTRTLSPVNKTTRVSSLKTLHRKVIPPKLCINKHQQTILLQQTPGRLLCTELESLMTQRCCTRRVRMWIFRPSRKVCMFLICGHLSMLSTLSLRARGGLRFSYANSKHALEASKNGTTFSITSDLTPRRNLLSAQSLAAANPSLRRAT